jgi:adenylate cyclase
MRELNSLNQQWRARAEAAGEPHHEVRFGIGFATGECSVGNFGSMNRFEYSALGDRVNLASRLEGATKFYRAAVLASETTRNMSPELAWLEVDDVRALGKSEVTKVFTLVGSEIEAATAEFESLADVHGRMLAAYRKGDFAAAASLARHAGPIAPPFLRAFYEAYEGRCDGLAASRPENWVAVTDLDAK